MRSSGLVTLVIVIARRAAASVNASALRARSGCPESSSFVAWLVGGVFLSFARG